MYNSGSSQKEIIGNREKSKKLLRKFEGNKKNIIGKHKNFL